MIAIKNLLFQPLTFQLAGKGRGLHLGPREHRVIDPKQVSTELKTAAQRGLVTLTKVVQPKKVRPKAAPASKIPSKATVKGKATATPRSRKRGGKP